VSVKFSRAVLPFWSTHDRLAIEALVWLHMVWFRAIWFGAVCFGASNVNLRQSYIFNHQIWGKNIILCSSKYGNYVKNLLFCHFMGFFLFRFWNVLLRKVSNSVNFSLWSAALILVKGSWVVWGPVSLLHPFFWLRIPVFYDWAFPTFPFLTYPCCSLTPFFPERENSAYLWIVGAHLPDYTLPQSRRPHYKTSWQEDLISSTLTLSPKVNSDSHTRS
jgi:hypothetical protein